MRRKRRNKQRKLIILTSLSLLFILTVGYAAFQTNLNITAKGNILEKGITIEELRKTKCNQTSGDGLYKDTYEEGRCIYKGTNPDNYITFNNELWRIISIEDDNTLKITTTTSIGTLAWDALGARDSSTNTYCTRPEHGCNAWSSTTSLVGTPSVLSLHHPNGNPSTDTVTYSGTVTQNASLNEYLNNDYYNTLSEETKSLIISHEWNVGTPGNEIDTEGLASDIKQEALYKWKGKVGLKNITETLRTTTNTNCISKNSAYGSDKKDVCNINNWLWPKIHEWTLSPVVGPSSRSVWYVRFDGYISSSYAYATSGVYPVVYLTQDLILTGKGSETNPYKVTKQ